MKYFSIVSVQDQFKNLNKCIESIYVDVELLCLYNFFEFKKIQIFLKFLTKFSENFYEYFRQYKRLLHVNVVNDWKIYKTSGETKNYVNFLTIKTADGTSPEI